MKIFEFFIIKLPYFNQYKYIFSVTYYVLSIAFQISYICKGYKITIKFFTEFWKGAIWTRKKTCREWREWRNQRKHAILHRQY